MGEKKCEKPCSVFGPSVSFCSASVKNFHSGASLTTLSEAFCELLGMCKRTINKTACAEVNRENYRNLSIQRNLNKLYSAVFNIIKKKKLSSKLL